MVVLFLKMIVSDFVRLMFGRHSLRGLPLVAFVLFLLRNKQLSSPGARGVRRSTPRSSPYVSLVDFQWPVFRLLEVVLIGVFDMRVPLWCGVLFLVSWSCLLSFLPAVCGIWKT